MRDFTTVHLTDEARQFLSDYHLATLSTVAKDGSIHVVPVGFTLRDGVARIISGGGSQKVRNIERDPHVTICQVEGGRWITITGTARVARDAASVAEAVELYAGRYRQPRPNPERVAIIIEIEGVLASQGMFD
ncbi:PPOX class F420-dependent oxidoreductase [Antiquaquibacter oligotrophicus]|uniref:PPOX class F420-dependent oxidoreductase n=1 Tax=Antiquaquibacter oligotrophicus TaxID=2880260 RepID=UPI002AC9EBFA|nr:PPOX class F420-dependent oxidoreductase [Antiquaquibacter oligotrophicus]UDF14081.1 PPOX class F420-dependent oxidoreductase [Antiquaquibacter oligotrophicus]